MKEKLESMKNLKENKIYLKLLILCVPHLLKEYQHNEYICVWISNKNIKVSITPL